MPSIMQKFQLICLLTLSANCFKRLYFTNCRMLPRTDISIGISKASPPSLTHECAGNNTIHQYNLILWYSFIFKKKIKKGDFVQFEHSYVMFGSQLILKNTISKTAEFKLKHFFNKKLQH